MKKILLIEDNDDIRNNIQEILELSNYSVIAAENGITGIEQAMQNSPDLITCDITMPVLDGFGVLEAIQKDDAVKNVPFIFLTAKSEQHDLQTGISMGADDYIIPFSGAELLNAVDKRLYRRNMTE